MNKEIHLRKRDSGSGDSIFLLHGNSSSIKVFSSVFDIAELPYNLIAMDLPGHGLSYRSSAPSWDYSIKNYREEVLKVIHNHCNGRVLLVGNSLGGHLCMQVAGNVKNLAGLVVFGSPPVKNPLNAEEAFMPNEGLAVFLSATSDSVTKLEVLSSLSCVKEGVDLIIGDFDSTDPHVRSTLALALGSQEDGFGDEFGSMNQLTVPKYIIQGSNEPSASLGYLEANQKELGYDLILINNSGHYPTLDQPRLFNQRLLEIATSVFR